MSHLLWEIRVGVVLGLSVAVGVLVPLAVATTVCTYLL